jgi:hypothetical protein
LKTARRSVEEEDQALSKKGAVKMGRPSISGQVPAQSKTAQTRSQWIILGLFILCINTKQSNADVKELTGE